MNIAADDGLAGTAFGLLPYLIDFVLEGDHGILVLDEPEQLAVVARGAASVEIAGRKVLDQAFRPRDE